MERIKLLYGKYREVCRYLIFGVLTTLVNYVAYLLLAPLFVRTTIPTVIAWVVSVLFAYLTNRRFVFQSRTRGKAAVKEAGAFFAARLLSGVLDVLLMAIFADMLGLNDKLVKLASNVFVVIFNYVASKLVIFRKR
jgi:putative flippase GtrA